MPFKSEKQRKYMWANEPKIAKRWANKSKKKGSRGSLLDAWANGKKKLER
jgi:hypothetical protein